MKERESPNLLVRLVASATMTGVVKQKLGALQATQINKGNGCA